MTVAPVIKIGETALRRRAPRLAGDARRAQIVEAASRFFADHGFSGPTRDLAASIGVTQALLYRYFDSKTDLIDAVFAEVFKKHWGDAALERFEADLGRPMVERLSDVYGAILAGVSATATRLFFRAGLDAYAGPISRSAALSWPLWTAIVEAWRREEALPSLAQTPLLEGERALVMALHDAMIMIRVREHVLHSERRLDDADEIRQVAETYDAGARAVLTRLHGADLGLRSMPTPANASDGEQVAA
ncbi:TetR/AcrR family transcriptional regulator [Chenggangzhangella methanolivorans]|uniref:TetR/AcrR family transcriptional regulator n=1 Tax=Chenggangzhangella methanolivorans TaxID=1437009 RepID=A0A9E6R6J7_9HYPH|nr:TetR/AcrR family transcriptional regulator [Chenggangzhangella methanolivorans]QZN98229.1 TetR/AcrR family transcriptional regulator [Chenggangzhangella methanolivorans]